MPKRNKEMDYYYDGMRRAYQILKEEGAEALDKEMRFRGLTGVKSRLTAREIDIGLDGIKELTINTVLTIALGTLYSEFGFGKVRLNRFKDVFMEGTKCLNNGIVTWADICYNIEDETGIHVSLIDELGRDTGMIREV